MTISQTGQSIMIAISMARNEEAVFVDTGYFVALELTKDEHHLIALQHWNSTSRSLPRLVTSSCVFDEVVTFFNNRGYHDKAEQLGDLLLTSSYIHLVHVDEPLFLSAWQYMRRHRDKEYSLTDCVSFLVMQEWGLSVAFAFDRHFLQAGFRTVP
jgi:predicted nucleic acid-binding protein